MCNGIVSAAFEKVMLALQGDTAQGAERIAVIRPRYPDAAGFLARVQLVRDWLASD